RLHRGNRLEHDGARRNARAGADLDIAKDLGAGADQHAVADLRMPVGALLAGTAECHAVQDRDIVADDGSLADDEPRRMIEEDAFADPGRRVDIRLENAGGPALQIQGKVPPALS